MNPTPERLSLGNHPDLVPLTLWPANLPDAAIVLVVPALGTPAGVYRRLALALNESGHTVAVLELRGVGESAVRPSRRQDWGYADLIDGEVQEAVLALRQRFPGQPLFLFGHSLGGHLNLLHQARYPAQAVEGLIFVASGAPFYRAYGGKALLVRGFGLTANWSSRVLGYFPGDLLGFGGRQGQRLMREWSQFVRSGEPEVSGWTTRETWRGRLRQLQRATLALTTAGDHYAPPASTAHLLGLSAIRTQIQHLQAEPGQPAPGHFGWLKQPQAVVARINPFLTQASTAASRAA